MRCGSELSYFARELAATIRSQHTSGDTLLMHVDAAAGRMQHCQIFHALSFHCNLLWPPASGWRIEAIFFRVLSLRRHGNSALFQKASGSGCWAGSIAAMYPWPRFRPAAYLYRTATLAHFHARLCGSLMMAVGEFNLATAPL